jgi:hypothetical protein
MRAAGKLRPIGSASFVPSFGTPLLRDAFSDEQEAAMQPRSNADFNPGDEGERSKEEAAERDDTVARKTKDIEESVRGNKGLSQARDDRGYDGSETDEALKRSAEQRNQNRP